MKKVFFSMSLMLVGLFFVACTNSAPKAEGGEKAADGTEVKAEGADGAEAINIDDLKSIAEKATKDGANWTEAEWKDAFKKVIKAVKPMLVEMKEMQKKIESASEEDQLIHKLVKAADKIAAYIKCLREESSGKGGFLGPCA